MAIKGRANKMVQASNYMDGRVSRTKVGRHFKWRSTFSSGYMIPFWCDEILPGQTKSVDLGELVRSITPLGPTMDNSFLDLFFFFVPNRLLWDHWEEFIAGYNKEAWTQDVVYEVPQIKLADDEDPSFSTTYDDDDFIHSFYDYLPGLGNPVDLVQAINTFAAMPYSTNEEIANKEAFAKKINDVFGFSALYPRAFVKIWNDWFRDENLQDEYQLYTGDSDELASSFAFNLIDGDAIPKMAKYHNRFTSLLPQPQKGPDVLIPMDNLQIGVPAEYSYFHGLAIGDDGELSIGQIGTSNPFNTTVYPTGESDAAPLVAQNISNTIRQLRLATQTELLLARDARGGTRYVESLLSHFGVHNGDARLQRSEYLGSKQIPLQVMQVTNTSSSDGAVLGNVGGQSVTKDNSHYFLKSFSEHGIVFCVGGVRTNISYSHGIRKMYQRKGRFDYIWPEFKHLGDVACYKKEYQQIYFTKVGGSWLTRLIDSDEVFGYTPYGSELREGYNFNNGLFRDNATGSLSYLTYQESLMFGNKRTGNSTKVILSDKYIQQDSNIVSGTLVDQSGPQFYALFDLYSEDVIPLDPTSDPGLMDHF